MTWTDPINPNRTFIEGELHYLESNKIAQVIDGQIYVWFHFWYYGGSAQVKGLDPVGTFVDMMVPVAWVSQDDSFSAAAAGGAAMGMRNYYTHPIMPYPVTVSFTEVVAIQAVYDQSTQTICGNWGYGGAWPPSKAFTWGILNEGNMDKWQDVVAGEGHSFGANVFGGYQMSTNSSGTVGGPSVVPGWGVSYAHTWGQCGQF